MRKGNRFVHMRNNEIIERNKDSRIKLNKYEETIFSFRLYNDDCRGCRIVHNYLLVSSL